MIGLPPGGPFQLPVCFVLKVWANPKIVGKTETVLYTFEATFMVPKRPKFGLFFEKNHWGCFVYVPPLIGPKRVVKSGGQRVQNASDGWETSRYQTRKLHFSGQNYNLEKTQKNAENGFSRGVTARRNAFYSQNRFRVARSHSDPRSRVYSPPI
jgi:hypothetical protein